MKLDVLKVLLLVWILGIGSFNINARSNTYEELMHWKYGLEIGQFRSERLFYPNYVDDSKMPISVFNAIPCLIRQCPAKNFTTVTLKEFPSIDFKLARLVTVFFALALGWFLFFWSKKWYGKEAGMLTLFLYALSPNILAHSQFITTDLYGAGFAAFAIYFFWKFMNQKGWKGAFISALTLGLAQLTKYSCLFLYPIFLFIILLKYTPEFCRDIKEKHYFKVRKSIKNFFKYFIFFVFINLIIINAGYFFNKTLTPLSDYQISSHMLKNIQKSSAIASIPIPLPYPYLQGIDRSMYNERTGSSGGNIYLMGKLQQTKTHQYKGFKGYYLIASLFKVPLATLAIFLISCGMILWNFKKCDFWNKEIFIIIPVLFFTVYLNYFFRMHIGIRHFLIIFPLVFIFCGSLLHNNAFFHKRFFRYSFIGLCLYLIISVGSYSPYFLSYFNELVLDRKMAYKILADSNIDLGCNVGELHRYLSDNPQVSFEPQGPVSGRIIVGVNELVGIFDTEKYRWLRENFEPTDHVAYSYLIYDISREDLNNLIMERAP